MRRVTMRPSRAPCEAPLWHNHRESHSVPIGGSAALMKKCDCGQKAKTDRSRELLDDDESFPRGVRHPLPAGKRRRAVLLPYFSAGAPELRQQELSVDFDRLAVG